MSGMRRGKVTGAAMRMAGLALLVLASACSQARAQDEGQNVFVVVIDGARYTETFGDPSRRYTPNMWDLLRPQGAVLTSFYNRGQTVTAGAHNTMTTGSIHWVDQHSDEWSIPEEQLPRPFTPTIFECFRAATGVPADAVWLIENAAPFMGGLTHSRHPEHGADYGASWCHSQLSDYELWQRLAPKMKEYHPRLVMINLHDTDTYAHQGNWWQYTRSIAQADQIVYELWQEIDDDPFYRGRTTLIVTNDHGRHTADFTRHYDCCEGCQHVMFLALGPGIKQGFVGEAERHLEDIGVTIAAIMGFPMPYAIDGSVMTELFDAGAPEGSGGTGSSSVVSSVAVEVVSTDRQGVPHGLFAPGERVFLRVSATNTGSIPVALHYATLSWQACRQKVAGDPIRDYPLQLAPGETMTFRGGVALPPAIPAGPLAITISTRGLDDAGQVIGGEGTAEITVQPN